MIDSDIGPFDRAFRRVLGAFAKRFKTAEQVNDLSTAYFQALRPWPLDAVLTAGTACIAKYKSFPKAADWIAELPANGQAHQAPADLRHMTVREMDEHERAAAKRHEDDPCGCPQCFEAYIHERPIRFVPTLISLLGDDYERAYNSRRNQVEVVGHWAHGAELARWYAGHDAFFAPRVGNSRQARLRRLVQCAVHVAGALEREPGEEG